MFSKCFSFKWLRRRNTTKSKGKDEELKGIELNEDDTNSLAENTTDFNEKDEKLEENYETAEGEFNEDDANSRAEDAPEPNGNVEESEVNRKTVEGKFSEDDVKSLAEELKQFDEIEFLQTEFIDGSFTVFCESLKRLKKKKLPLLHFNNVTFSPPWLFTEAEFYKLKLKELCDVGPKLKFKFTPSVSNVDLGDLNFGDKAIKQLSELFKEVKYLNLSCNKITPVGAQYLAESLEDNDKVNTIYLANNKLGRKGVEHLLPLIPQLEYIVLSDNNITSAETYKLLSLVVDFTQKPLIYIADSESDMPDGAHKYTYYRSGGGYYIKNFFAAAFSGI